MTDEQYQQLLKVFSRLDRPYMDTDRHRFVSEFNGSGFDRTYEQILEIFDLDYNPNVINRISMQPMFMTHKNDPIKPPEILFMDKRIDRKVVLDVKEIEFMNLYPTIMRNIIQDDNYQIATDLSTIIGTVLKFRERAKKEMFALKSNKGTPVYDVFDVAQINAKVFINYTYGKCNNSKYLAASFDVAWYIRNEVGHMWRKLRQGIKQIGGELLYFDIDTGFFVCDEDSYDQIDSLIKSMMFEYDIADVKGIHVIRKKMVNLFRNTPPPEDMEFNHRRLPQIRWEDLK